MKMGGLGLIFHRIFFVIWICGQITFSHFLKKIQIHFKSTSETDFQDYPTHKISMFCTKAVLLMTMKVRAHTGNKGNLVDSILHVN